MKRRLQCLMLIMGSFAACAQNNPVVIHITLIDGLTGLPMRVQKVGLEDRAGFRDISVVPDASGVAALTINPDAVILTHNTPECGHAWQGRYYSCPLGEAHLWQALRYVGLNPVRAGLVSDARVWPWSSAAVHTGGVGASGLVALDLWRDHWSTTEWRGYLAAGEQEAELAAIRRSTYTGRPLGNSDFVSELEQLTHRRLAPRKGGRPKKPQKVQQNTLTFAS